MLIPVRYPPEAGVSRDKSDEAYNYNNMAGAVRNDRTRAGWLWRKLEHTVSKQH